MTTERHRPMHARILLFSLVIGLTGYSAIFAQENEALRRKLQRGAGEQKELETPPEILATFPALEATVDPETYIIGPGDKFYINIPGYMEEGFQTMVTAEGVLIIPTVGRFRASGQSLAQLQQQVQAKGREKYLHTRITANLIDIRFFRVHVLGEVRQPGLYSVRQTYRMTDALNLAGGASDWADLSAIEIRRHSGGVETIDLNAYLSQGDLAGNPQVLDGDVIYVPRVSEDMPFIRVEGRIQSPGIYFARPDETPQAFLLRLRGVTRKADLLSAVIKRPNGANGAYAVLPIFTGAPVVHANGESRAPAASLRTGDVISIPSLSDSVYVQGAVFRPGAYPYFPNFFARDYVGLAGPTEQSAGLKGIRVRHPATGSIEDGPDTPVRPGDTIQVKIASRTILKDYMQIVATITGQVFTFLTLREALRR